MDASEYKDLRRAREAAPSTTVRRLRASIQDATKESGDARLIMIDTNITAGPDLRTQTEECYGCFSSRKVSIAEARSPGFSRKDKCPEGISALFARGIKSVSS